MVFSYSQNYSYPSYYYQRVELSPEALEMKIKNVFIVDDHPVAEMAKKPYLRTGRIDQPRGMNKAGEEISPKEEVFSR